MADSSKPSLNMLPFPPLQWSDYFWTGQLVLSSWRGFQRRLGAYAAKSSSEESDGTVRLSVAPHGGVAEKSPSAEQANALRYLLEHQEAIRDALVAAIFEEYLMIRRNRLGDGFVDASEMPVFERPEELKAYIGLSTVHVLQVVKNDAAYVGFEFGCNWDDEHGLGIMTHQGRIVELPHMDVGKVNGADMASEEWMAEEDAQSPEPVVEEDISPFAEAQRAGPRCSFCGQTADKVGPLVEGIGPKNEGGVFICSACVERLQAVFAADSAKKETRECLRCHAVIAKEAARCPECGFPRL